MKSIIIAVGISLFILTACFKDNTTETLPAETQSGKGTFGCYVNNQLWVQKGYLHFGISGLRISIDNKSFNIIAERFSSKSNIQQSLFFKINTPLKKGIYNLNSTQKTSGFIDYISDCFYNTDTTAISNGILEITKYDSIQNIVSGTFSFTAYKSYNNNKTNYGSCDSCIKITKGRFDINNITYY